MTDDAKSARDEGRELLFAYDGSLQTLNPAVASAEQ